MYRMVLKKVLLDCSLWRFVMQAFIGIDVSKSKLNVCVITKNSKVRKKVVKNSGSGFVVLNNWFMKHNFQIPHIYMKAIPKKLRHSFII